MTPTPMTLERARVNGAGLEYEEPGGLQRALRDGCFLLAIPDDLDVDPGVRLCREFYRAEATDDPSVHGYRGFTALEGVYFDREHFQTEHILLDGPARLRHLPREANAMCDRLSELGLLILRTTMSELGIDRTLWSTVTGGAVDGNGTHWFAASHYRPERDQMGCAPHKDTGFTTILYIEQEGLEAFIGDKWWSIDPVPGYFVVNYGGAFELLCEKITRPVKAILHRVRRCEPSTERGDRFSFAAFANPPASGDLYQISRDGTAVPIRSVEDFLRRFNETTWHDRHDDFGIATPGAEARVERAGGTR